MTAKKETKKEVALARVLVGFPLDGKDYAANDLVEFPAESIESLKKSGVVDDGEGAIAYCTNVLNKKPMMHVVEVAEQESQGEAE